MKRLLYDRLRRLYEVLGRPVSVGLLGLGTTNYAAMNILLGMQDVATVTVRQRGLSCGSLPDAVRVRSDEQAFSDISEDVLLPSPSVRRERLSLPEGARCITDLDLLFEHKPKKLFTVSGSDGKSTTVSIASLLLSPTFPDIFTGGNIGVPLWEANLDCGAFLLELSSFSLRYSKPRGGRALLTNVTPNHLDWHKDLDEYEKTKLGMIYSADEPILCLDDPASERVARVINTFCLISGNMSREEITARYKTEHTVTIERGAIRLDGLDVVRTDSVKRNEKHNLLNLASAIALSIGYADREHVREVAESFDGLAERCESFTIGGVRYISSSIDTTPERTRTTLEGLGKRVRLILGGRGKGLSPEPLKDALIRYAERIAVYGEVRDEITDFINSDAVLRDIPHAAFERFDSAVDYATEECKAGETVLLSPAATGYGEFSDYKERGLHFKEYIKRYHGKTD